MNADSKSIICSRHPHRVLQACPEEIPHQELPDERPLRRVRSRQLHGHKEHVDAVRMPPRNLHRLVPLRSQVLQRQRPDEKLRDELQVRDKDLQDVPLVRVLRIPEAAVPLGRMTLVNIFCTDRIFALHLLQKMDQIALVLFRCYQRLHFSSVLNNLFWC